ncbi:hypothetical protein SDC9_208206 [bioreactor metagenome]|uniref:Uncharacterized protein n=1 Tax=bioreactor metagenome TaxID=1076179 RepID=A0A645J9Z8_9ZZZZ
MGVHFPKTFVTLDGVLAAVFILEHFVKGLFIVDILDVLSPGYLKKRRLGNIHIAFLNQTAHIAVEEG